MSFSDLMSSGRGPGVIGMLMALLVIGGFGMLFMFAFDSEMQGKGVTIESIIRDQAKEIEEIKHRIVLQKKVLETAPQRLADNARWEELKRQNVYGTASVKSLTEGIEKSQEEYLALTKGWEDYKNEYRTYARSKGVGESLAELTTKTGSIYKRVEIRDVTAIGIQIRHEDGQKRIPFEELPDAMQDRFQFDAANKEVAVAAENKHREEHEAAAAVANQLQEKDMEAARARQEIARKEGMKRSITAKRGQISQLQTEIQSLELQISQANAQASAARASGRMVLTRIGVLRPQIRAKHNQIFALKNEIAALDSALRN
jgi:chromosome segregation ATPase